eukprot:8965021-Alexandrium_andersonii.AAC.1
MSASLVGSEMCIRDRLPGAIAALMVAPSAHKDVRDTAVDSHPYNAIAVSYTHLTLPTICSV